MVDLVEVQIDTQSLLQRVKSPNAGATVLFVGTTRRYTNNRETKSLDYECYEQMARRQLQQLETTARSNWELCDCCIVHRLGNVPIGEASVAVAVSSAHRKCAFEAGEWLIDELKKSVPIWKKERWADGTSEWVHPGVDTPAGERVE